jgi:hypothetical protein
MKPSEGRIIPGRPSAELLASLTESERQNRYGAHPCDIRGMTFRHFRVACARLERSRSAMPRDVASELVRFAYHLAMAIEPCGLPRSSWHLFEALGAAEKLNHMTRRYGRLMMRLPPAKPLTERDVAAVRLALRVVRAVQAAIRTPARTWGRLAR